jgi:predicted NBD/HSP70 family sugar kinase
LLPCVSLSKSGEPLTVSEKRLLALLFRHGSQTQAQLSETTGLTQQSASRLVSGLIDRGMVEEGEKVPTGKRGYPSATVRLRPDHAYSVGISIMADAVAATLVDFSGAIIEERLEGLPAMSVSRVLGWLEANLSDMVSNHVPASVPVVGAGVGITGSHIAESGGFNTPFSLEEWAGRDLADILSPALGLPVWSDNDGNVAALGESMIGVGRWAKSFAYVYIATGVGGGLVLNGDVWRGRHGNAGEFAGGLPPNIYPFPNLELLRQLVVRDGAAFDNVHELVAGFDPTWPAIDEWVTRVRDSLSIIVSNATAILDLDAVVLGGQIPKALSERVISHLELFDQKRRGVHRPMAKIVSAEAEGNSTALGAAILPLQETFFS